MEPTHVIKMPIVTEKATAAGEHNQYAFKVDQRATKTDVKKAIEAIYGVKVVDVRTQVRQERDRTCLVAVAADNRNAMLSARNIDGVDVRRVEQLNAYDLLNHRYLVVDKASLASFIDGSCFPAAEQA